MKKKLFLLLPAFFLALSLGACNAKKGGDGDGDNGDNGGQTTTVAVTGVSVNPTSLTLTVGGETGKITATVAPADATNKNVTWTSSAPAIATVANGVVTPVAAGDAVITVKTVDGEKTATCNVKVNAAASTDPTDPVDPTKLNLKITGYPADKTAEHYAVHAWGGADTAQNYEATLSETTLTATVPADVTGFLVAAYNGEFNWDNLVFKSADIAIVSGQTEYAIPDPSSKISITVTELNADYANTDYDVYAYAWGGASTSDFLTVTRDGTSATFEVAASATGCLLLRMAKDNAPSWEGKLDQTQDINIESGTTSYPFPGVK